MLISVFSFLLTLNECRLGMTFLISFQCSFFNNSGLKFYNSGALAHMEDLLKGALMWSIEATTCTFGIAANKLITF